MTRCQLASALLILSAALASPAHAGGSIRGQVTLVGTAPAPVKIDRSRDFFCAKTEAWDEDLVVHKGKIRDVHVGIESHSAGRHTPPTTPVVIEQKNCSYRPRVVGIMEGQALDITNGDQTFHNVHAYVGAETFFNRAQPAGAKPIRSNTAPAGTEMKFACDIHPWMRGYAVVTDHPYFDVTDEQGAFTIANVPAGRYTLRAWHPKLGTQKQTIEVVDGKTTTVSFRLK